jgi:hypothetical protein
MAEEKSHVISFRMSEETYSALKNYADGQGQSVNEAARSVVEKFLAGTPGPGPGPTPPSQVTIPSEILELPGKFQAMLQYEVEIRQYVVGLSGQVGELQKAVRGMLSVMFPGMPLPPWGVMSAMDHLAIPGMGELGDLADLADGGKAP